MLLLIHLDGPGSIREKPQFCSEVYGQISVLRTLFRWWRNLIKRLWHLDHESAGS